MPQVSWEKAKTKNPEAFESMFRKLNATDDENFKKSYKASTEAEKKVIDEVLKEYGLHMMISNGRIIVMEEKPQQANQQQDVLVSQVIQAEMQRQNLFERGKALSKDFFKKAYEVVAKVLSTFFFASKTVMREVGRYLARHSPAEHARAIFYITFTVLMFEAFYAVVNLVKFAGVKMGEGLQAIGEGAQYTSEFIMQLFGSEKNQTKAITQEEKETYTVPRVSFKEEMRKEIELKKEVKEPVKERVKPTIHIPKMTNPFVEPTRIASETVAKSAETVANSFVIVGGLSVFMLIVLGLTKEYFSHQRYLLERKKTQAEEAPKAQNNNVDVEEEQFHHEMQRQVKTVKVTHKPVAWQRNLTERDHETARTVAEALRITREIQEKYRKPSE